MSTRKRKTQQKPKDKWKQKQTVTIPSKHIKPSTSQPTNEPSQWMNGPVGSCMRRTVVTCTLFMEYMSYMS